MDEIAEFRRFSRFYTRVVGALDTGHLDTPFSLSEARIIYEVATRGRTSAAEIARVAREYAVYYQAQPPADGAPPNAYLVDHSRMITLYDPQGRPMAILPEDQGPAGIANELDRWVR